MELHNATGLLTGYAPTLAVDAREHTLVVVRGTFAIPERGGVAEMAQAHDPLVYADTFTGKPGFSAVQYECDFAAHKPLCDVLLLGQAYAPAGRGRQSRVRVGLRVGSLFKEFEVVGKRHWTASLRGGVTPSSPEPFSSMPISYDRAFGGGFPGRSDPSLVLAYPDNPVGIAYGPEARDTDLFGTPLPNTQELGVPVDNPRKRYRPMAFGPIGRNFSERLAFAGTYDEAWLQDGFPLLPPDFDARYFQAAPADQQLPYLRGGETVELQNLTEAPLPPFQLPTLDVPVEFTNDRAERTEAQARLDTLILEPDRMCLHLVWRASLPMRRSIRELREVVIGRMSRAFYRARQTGKRYYPSLGALVEAQR